MVQCGKGNIKDEKAIREQISTKIYQPEDTSEQDNEGRNITRNQRLMDKDSEY